MEIKITRKLIELALKRPDLKKEDQEFLKSMNTLKDSFISLDTTKISVNLLSFFLRHSTNLPNKTKATLSARMLKQDLECDNIEEVWNTKIYKLADIVECFTRIGVKTFNCDIFFNNSWFPVIALPRFVPANTTFIAKAWVDISIKVSFGKEVEDIGFGILQEHLIGLGGASRNPTLGELFREFSCRPQSCDLDAYNGDLKRTEELKNTNKKMLCSGHALVKYMPYKDSTKERFRSVRLGIKKQMDRVIIESTLEYKEEESAQKAIETNQGYIALPLIRVFSLTQKKYGFVDVKNLINYEYNSTAHKRIFLPEKIKKILTTVFAAPIEAMVGDIVDGKHGGMIIMAHGTPGIGKTSTAEVYSELKEMPLYPIDIAELGISADVIEKNLNVIFRRVEKWGAIVLFDEIDVFLAKREKNDLNRTAIVGVFLRLMDYFKGVMFMTSNRPEVLDSAISSRITLKIKYPDLDHETRIKIWKEKLSHAKIKVEKGLNKLAEVPLNGREIRNLVRLTKIIHPKKVTEDDIISIVELSFIENETKTN